MILLRWRSPTATADAEVLDAAKTTSRIGLVSGGTYAYLWKVRIRVLPSTEQPFETTVKEYFAFGSAPDVGARFTVRYRPGRQRGVRVDYDVPGTFTPGADRAPERDRYGYKQPIGGIPAVRREEPQTVGLTIDLRASRDGEAPE
jgi:hypothetical protein